MILCATIMTILAIFVLRKWKLCHLDVCNAFLNGHDEIVMSAMHFSMEQPLGFAQHTLKTHVCQLHGAIYGLK